MPTPRKMTVNMNDPPAALWPPGDRTMRAIKAGNSLKRGSIGSIEVLTGRTADELLDIPYLGAGQLNEIRYALGDAGLALCGELPATRQAPATDEIKLGAAGSRDLLPGACDLASAQDQMTWLTDAEGKHIAAIVPAEMAEYAIRHGYFVI